MRAPDVFLDSDYGVRKALSPLTSKDIKAVKDKCRPFGSYAVFNLWNSL